MKRKKTLNWNIIQWHENCLEKLLPEDGDVVVNENELQHNPMNRKYFRKIVNDEHGVYFQDVETEETVWQLPEHGEVVS